LTLDGAFYLPFFIDHFSIVIFEARRKLDDEWKMINGKLAFPLAEMKFIS